MNRPSPLRKVKVMVAERPPVGRIMVAEKAKARESRKRTVSSVQ
jgi:hypothetical protein